MRIVSSVLIGFACGFIVAWLLFGLQILTKTHWTWTIGDPIEMEGTIISTTGGQE